LRGKENGLPSPRMSGNRQYRKVDESKRVVQAFVALYHDRGGGTKAEKLQIAGAVRSKHERFQRVQEECC
jgi:hypothetical protein